MFSVWWPAFIVPVLMVLGGLLGSHIPGNRYRSPGGELDEERQQLADRQMHHMLWQFGLVYAALAFMVMRSVRLVPENVQSWLSYGAIALETAGVLLMALPIERALHQQFDEEKQDDKGDIA